MVEYQFIQPIECIYIYIPLLVSEHTRRTNQTNKIQTKCRKEENNILYMIENVATEMT